MPEDNRGEEQRVRETLHLQALPHTCLLGEASDPLKGHLEKISMKSKKLTIPPTAP